MLSRTLAFVAATLSLAACGGGDKKPETSPAQQAPTSTAAAAPITGTTHVVQMVGDAATGYRYDPAALTIKTGDGIKFDGVSGGPHNVSIDGSTLSADARNALIANMPSQDLGELSSKLINDKESYTVSFANVPAGTYQITCTPHAASNMKMTVTVEK